MTRPRFFYGWVVAGAAAAINLANASAAIVILSMFVNPMGDELGWSRTEIAGAVSLGAVLGALVAPPSGWLVDRFGSRLVLVVGGIVITLACLYLSVVQALLGFYIAFAAIRASDLGVISVGTSAAIGKWFLLFRGRATGLVYFAESAGIIVLAPIIQVVINVGGWRTAWVVMGGLMFVVGVVPAALLMRRQPEDMGLIVDGRASIRTPETYAAVSSDKRQTEEVSWPVSQMLRTLTFWLLLVSLFVVSIGISGVGVHLVPHLTQQGVSAQTSVGAISVMFAAGALASLAVGVVSERVSLRLLMALTYLLVGISLLILIAADTIIETYLFAITHGFAMTAFFVMPILLWPSYYGRASLGFIYGISRAAQVGGLALGPVVAGLVYDTTQSYQSAFVWFAILAGISSLIFLFVRRPTLSQG